MASDVARIYLVTDVLDNYKAIASKVKKQAKEAAKDAKIDLGIDIKDNEIEKALTSINKRLGEKTFREVNFSNITTSFFSDLINPKFDAETKKDLIINFNRFIKNIRPDMVAEINNLGEEESHKVLENIFSIFSTKNAEKYFGQSGTFTKIGKENLQSEFDAIINKYSIDFNKRIQSNVFSQIFSDENYKKELNGVKKYLEDSETLIESFINSYMKYANLGTTSSLQDMMGITAVYQNFTGDKALKGVYDFITKEEKLTERQKELANEFKTAIRDDLFLNPDEEITKDIFKGFIDEQIVPNFEDTYVKSIVKKAKKLGQKMAEERDKIIKEQLEYQETIERTNKDNPEQEVVYKDLEHFERERDALGRFKQAVVDVTEAIRNKTQAIAEEERQMNTSVENEINILDNLLLKVNELQDKLTNDFKIKINTELDNIDLNGALNNIFESLTKIPQNIKEGNYSEVSSNLNSVADIIQGINEANEYILNYSSFIDNQNIPLENKDMRFANRRNLKERALFWNKKTGEHSNPFIYDQAGGVGGDFLKALRESGKYTSYLHTHPVKYAVPSGADFKSFAKEFEMGIEEAYIASLDEIFEFNIKDFRKKASKYDLINISKLIDEAMKNEVYKEDPYYKENHKDILGQDIFNRLKEGTKANGYNLNNLSQDAKTIIKNDETLMANIGKETANFISENLSTILERGLQNLNAQNFDKSTWGKTIPRIIEEYVLEANNDSLNVNGLRNNIKKSKVNSFLSEIFNQTRGELFFEGERNLFEQVTGNMEKQIISDYLKKKDIKLNIDDIWKTYSYDEFFKAHPELQVQKDSEYIKKENKKTETIDVKIDNITLPEKSIQEIITKIQDELKKGEFLLEINNLSLSEEAKGNFVDSIKNSLNSQSITIDKINISSEAISSSLQSSELNSENNLKTKIVKEIDDIQIPFIEKEGFTSMNNSIQTIKEILNLIEELQYTNNKGFFNKLPKELPEGDKNIEGLKKQYEQYIEYYESIAQLNKIIKKENFSEEQKNILYGVINDGRVSRMSLGKVEARIAEYKQNYLKLFNTRKDSGNVEIPTNEINKINKNAQEKIDSNLNTLDITNSSNIVNNIKEISDAIWALISQLEELQKLFQNVFVLPEEWDENKITNLTEKISNIRSILDSINTNTGTSSFYNDYITNNYSSGLDSDQFNIFITALSEMYELMAQVQEAWNQGFETKGLEDITNTFNILTEKIDGVIFKIASLAETLGKIDASKITISDDKQVDKKSYTQQQRILAKQIKEITRTEREYQELKNRINNGETLTSFNDIYKYNKEKALREDLARKQKDVAYDEAFNSKYIESLMQAKRQNEKEVNRALQEFNVKANQQNQFEEKEQSINKVINAIKILIDTELEYQKLNKEWNTDKSIIEKDPKEMNKFIDLGKKRNEAITILNSQEAIDVSDDDRVIDAIIKKREKEISVDTSLDLEEIRKKEIEEEKILNAKVEAQKQADLESQKQIQTTLDFYDKLISTEQEYQTLLLKRKNSELTVEEQRKMALLEKDRLTKVLTQEEAKKMGLTQEEAEKAVGYDYYANTSFGKNIFTSSVVQQKANDYLQIRDNIGTDVLEKERLSNILNTINEIKKAYAEYSTLITKQVISEGFINTSDLKRLNELKEILGAIIGETNGVDSLGVALNNLINSGQGNTKNVNGFINGMNKYLEAVDEASLGKLYETYGGTEKEYQKLMAKQVYTKNLDTESSSLTVNEQNELIRLETKRSFLLDEINKREAMSVNLSTELVQKRADLVSLENSYAKSYNEAWQNKKGDELQTPYDQINELQRLVTTSDGKYITTDEYKTKLSDLKKEADSLKEILKTIDYGNPESVENFNKSLDNLKIKVKDAKNELKNFQSKDATKLMRNIAQFLEKNHGISEESRDALQEYYKEIEDGSNLSIGRVRELGQAVTEIIAKETMAGNVGMTFFDTLNQRAKGLLATLMTYVSFYRIIGYIKQGFNTFKQFDSALAEMQKVSNETINTLKEFQQASFDLADGIGTDALSLQQSVAEFMRLGQTLDEATDSAQAANILFNVSEFESAKDASTALIAMSQAYDELSNTQIIDVINKLGNDFPISTEGLATALQDGAASLTTAGNDFYEAAALVTAGNRITQDPSKVGKAMRTIALRLTGTEASAEELEADGEEVEGMIKNVSKLREVVMQATKVDSNNNKGIDILNDVGAYKSTYDILLEIAEIYDEIVEKDKQYGTKQANLLLETIAGRFCLKNMETYFYRTHLTALVA